ncbi:MAG: LPS export ABC transporter periplasmic protein LptC [Alphaproteobacteria bacterium]
MNQDISEKAVEEEKRARLERLSARARDDSARGSVQGYSTFVRVMRLALPLLAAVIIAILYYRSGSEDPIVNSERDAIRTPQLPERSIAKNELINPRFENLSKENHPYEIVAQRAVQGEVNKDLIMLERPEAVITMEDGAHLRLRSQVGAYRQDTRRFFLEGDVFLNHDEGYILRAQEAHIDLKEGVVWSDEAVSGRGPDLQIDARGMRANSETGEIVFTGPATLLLRSGMEGFSLNE